MGRRAPSPADAEDVVQEGLSRVWRHAATLRDDERFTAWVRRIADNALADHLRARQRHPLPRDAAGDPAAPAEEGGEAPRGPSARDQVAAVPRPFAEALPERYRKALVLSELDGLPHADIAARLGRSVSGIKSRVRRGRALLRQALARCCELGLDARNTVVSCEVRPDAAPRGCCGDSPARRGSAGRREDVADDATGR